MRRSSKFCDNGRLSGCCVFVLHSISTSFQKRGEFTYHSLSLEIDENAVSPCTLLTPHCEVVTMSFGSLTIVGSIAHLNIRLKLLTQAPHSPMGSARTPKQHAENLNFPENR
jgi:hypothetical protein